MKNLIPSEDDDHDRPHAPFGAQLMSAVERDFMKDLSTSEGDGLRTAFGLDLAVLEANSGPKRTNTHFGLSFEPLVIQLCLVGKSPHS